MGLVLLFKDKPLILCYGIKDKVFGFKQISGGLECTLRSGQRVQEISTLPEGVREEDSSWQLEEGLATFSSAW
jgi:hypothetical protein